MAERGLSEVDCRRSKQDETGRCGCRCGEMDGVESNMAAEMRVFILTARPENVMKLYRDRYSLMNIT